jgi:endonuclease YncB( thermonuclease family)
LTPAGEDLAEAALLAGIGRVAEGASPAYRDAEAKARRQGKGLWAKQ